MSMTSAWTHEEGTCVLVVIYFGLVAELWGWQARGSFRCGRPFVQLQLHCEAR